jgi:copper resistance protein D
MAMPQLIGARAVHIAASILFAGIFSFDLVVLGWRGRPASGDFDAIERPLFRLAIWTLVVAVFSALFWFSLEVASMSGLPLKNAFSTMAWRRVLFETQFGRVWQFRVGVIAAAFALIASGLPRVKARRPLILLVWMLGVFLLGSLAWISHAAAATTHALGVLGDALHLCAAGTWIGGLVPLAIFLARVRASFSLDDSVVPVLQRFSTLSLCCVSVLVLSGISNSWLLVGSIYALFTTPYGRLLVFKLTLFGMLVALGARNRFIVKKKLRESPAGSDLLPQLRRNVLCELCLGVGVVAIVACLGVTPPARHL